MQIGPGHPLSRLFTALVQRRYSGIDLREPRVARYVSSLLVEFTHVRNLYRIRNAQGKRLEDVAEMLVESNPLLAGRSFEREREVRKHIGDYTLFLAGLFPEYVASLPRRGLRLDAFIDYLKAGKESYHIVSCFDLGPRGEEAPLFRRLADSFELCVYGLNLVQQDLQAMEREYYQGLRSQLEQ